MVDEARESHCSLQAVARLRKKEKAAGASQTSVFFWSKKVFDLYFAQNKLVFLQLPHLCFVTDASTHSSKDTLATIVYNKRVSALDFDLAEDVQALAATRKIERLAAYRFFVALSNQVSEVTQGRHNLASYFSPEAMHLSPPGPNQKRFQSRGSIVIKNEETNESVIAEFSEAGTTPILSVCIDQGGIGAVPGIDKLKH